MVNAHTGFEKAYNDFKKTNFNKLPHKAGLSENVTSEGLQYFYESKEFTDFQSTYGCEYKGLLCDPLTPLEQYITDTLHLCIILANMLKDQLAVPLLQQIEDSVPGLGPHVLHAASKTAGFTHLALHVVQYARKAYKSKLVDLSTCKQKGCIGGVTIQTAVLDEFKKFQTF